LITTYAKSAILSLPIFLAKTKQFCEAVMIYRGSGSDFGKVLVPFPVPVSVPDNIKNSFPTKIFYTNFAFSMLKAALFTRKFASYF
jgi:hypothetical protein